MSVYLAWAAAGDLLELDTVVFLLTWAELHHICTVPPDSWGSLRLDLDSQMAEAIGETGLQMLSSSSGLTKQEGTITQITQGFVDSRLSTSVHRVHHILG